MAWPNVVSGQPMLASVFNALSSSVQSWQGNVSAAGYSLNDVFGTGFHTPNATWQEFRVSAATGGSQALDTLLLQYNTRTTGGGSDAWVSVFTVGFSGVTVNSAINFAGAVTGLAGLPNSTLANSSVTVNVGSGLTTTSPSIALGASSTLNLAATVPTSVVGDTNVTASIASNVLTIAWAGTLAKSRQYAGTAYTDQANTFGAGLKQVFTASAVAAGLNLASVTADPSGTATGDLWFRSDLSQVSLYNGTTVKRLATADQIPSVPVASVFGRTGVVVATANDYSFSLLSGSATLAQLPTIPASQTSGFGSAALLNSAVANGVATLDGSGKLTTAQIPASLVGAVVYQGVWNAATNTPALASGTGTKGFYYKVSTPGTITIDGINSWNLGDTIIFDGTNWDKIDGQAIEVVSVFGRSGSVVAAANDYSFAQLSGTASNAQLANSAVTVTAGAGLATTSSSISLGASTTLSVQEPVNAQTGTTYTFLSTDQSKLVTINNAASIAGTLPLFSNGWFTDVVNLGVGTFTITPASGTIGGGSTLAIATGQSARIVVDGTNAQIVLKSGGTGVWG